VVKAVEISTTLYKYSTGFYLFIIGLVPAMPCNGPIFKLISDITLLFLLPWYMCHLNDHHIDWISSPSGFALILSHSTLSSHKTQQKETIIASICCSQSSNQLGLPLFIGQT